MKREGMFKKKMLLFSSIMSGVILIWLFQMVVVRKSDFKRYQEIIKKRELASSFRSSSSNQQRKNVRKDIWFAQDNNSRVHHQIASEGSILTLTPIHNKFEVVEYLKGVKCWMQDKLIMNELGEDPFQQARYIEAQSGIYKHGSQEFTANGVLLSLFRLPGHSLPTTPLSVNNAFLHGSAQDVSFFLSGKTTHFQAEGFKAMVVKE